MIEHPTKVEDLHMQDLTQIRRCPECGHPLIASPVLECAHCGEQITLRCFTYGPRRGRYFAECIDLDLISQGNSPEEAIGKLQEAMFSYIETVFDGQSTKGLVLRLSPLSHRLHYHLRVIGHWLSGLLTGRHRKHLMPLSDRSSVRLSHC